MKKKQNHGRSFRLDRSDRANGSSKTTPREKKIMEPMAIEQWMAGGGSNGFSYGKGCRFLMNTWVSTLLPVKSVFVGMDKE